MPENRKNNQLTFWEHLDELRGSLVRIISVVLIFGVIAFGFKDFIFSILLAPKNADFITYRYLAKIIGSNFGDFRVDLINTGLAQQFMIHMKAAFAIGFLFASPYIIYILFKFVSPALYANERRSSLQFVSAGYIMFLMGVILNYFLIFPLTFRFLGTYQVSAEIPNMINIESYMSTLLLLSLLMGAMFELPILSWALAAAGLLKADFMRHYRRHAIVIILITAAVITPTADIFTLLVVSTPIYFLYEASIIIVSRKNRS